MKKRMLTGLLALSMVVCLAGCGGNKTAQTSVPQGQQKEVGKNEAGSKMAAIVISIAQGDPFLTLAYAGVEQLGEEYGIETKIIEALDKLEYSEQIWATAEAGANPIYMVWGGLATEAIKIASDFPDTKFIVVDCYVTSGLGSVKTIVVEPQEAAFIAGAVAAETPESKRVSWIGSTDQPVINKFRAGFEAGVAYVDLSVECESLYTGNASNPNKGDELAKQIIGKGADMVIHSANKAGLGAIRACEGEDTEVIGAGEWQGAINGDIVFWSVLKDITDAVYHAGRSALDNTLTVGMDVHNISSGLKLYDDRDYARLPDDVKKKVDETVEKMKNGEIEIPSDIGQ